MHTLVALSIICLACGGSTPEAETPSTSERFDVPTGDVQAAIEGPHRTADERARDRYRQPAESLAHFGLRSDMVVVEIWPGRGWYTKILAPVLRGGTGRLILANFDPADTTFRGTFARQLQEQLAEHPELYDQVDQTVLFKDQLMPNVADASVDLVLSFRNTHNWVRWEGHSADAYFGAVARVLKPGGVFGVVQHRAPEGFEHGEDGTIGYLTESWVIARAQAAGLELAGRSDMHANASDTHEHPEGVWSLPPVLRGGDEGREGFVAVGESDRMTLTFRKPTDGVLGALSPEAERSLVRQLQNDPAFAEELQNSVSQTESGANP